MEAIGIIVAMDKELNLLLPLLENNSSVTINGVEFHRGNIGKNEVVVLKCGIGKVNAAISTLTLIENFHVRLVINTGVAGGTGNNADILDVVIADRIAYHDVWCGPGTIPGQAADCPLYFECPMDFENAKFGHEVKFGLIASGDIFVSHPDDLDKIKRLYPDVMAVDMESAAIAQVCFLKNVPFVAIRVISDTPGKKADNMSQYNDFWTLAPKKNFELLKALLSKL